MSATKKMQEWLEPLMAAPMMKMWTGDGAGRMEGFVDEWEKWQKKGMKQAEEAVEESASLMQATMEYSLELQKAAQEQALENSRKALAMWSDDEEG